MDNNSIGAEEIRIADGLDEAVERIDQAEDRFRAKTREILDTAQEKFERARMETALRMDEIDQMITERPYAAVAIAAVGALVVGYLLGLRQPRVIVIRPAHGRG
jgi:ElaB/YqjD/DUF883 family membrane-anchored ribosome-binding protein